MEVHHHPKVENPAHGGTGEKIQRIFFGIRNVNSVITTYHYLYAVTEVNSSAAIKLKRLQKD